MADVSVSNLPAAEQVTTSDLFVMEQNGAAKKVTGQVLINCLADMLDGHGGIKSINKQTTSGLADTYRVTFADTTTFDFVITNGRSIKSIVKTGTIGLVDTYTITYNDNTTSAFNVTNGAQGDTGQSAYVWIKYASQEPTEESHSMGDMPDAWMGIYSGTMKTAPTEWHVYNWYEIKGKQGLQGLQGEPGTAPKFSIGSVTVLEPDQKPTATITGTAEYPILNFGIPRGKDGADGTGSPNWDLNDSSADGYIQNRTHYTKSAESQIASTSLTLDGSGATDLAIKMSYAAAEKLIKVTWAGTDYTAAMRDITYLEDATTYAVGNLSIMDSAFMDTGEPFLLKYDADAGNIAVLAPDYAGSTVDIVIYYAEVVVKLDNKYLDMDWLPTKEVVGSDGILLPETSIQFTSNIALAPGFAEESLQEGGAYIVYWNGTAYQVECYLDADKALALGNGSLAGYSADTGEPFYIVSYGGSSNFVYKELDSRELITIKLVGHAKTEYNRMPAEYMPEYVDGVVIRSSGGKKFRVTVSDSGTLTTTAVT